MSERALPIWTFMFRLIHNRIFTSICSRDCKLEFAEAMYYDENATGFHVSERFKIT